MQIDDLRRLLDDPAAAHAWLRGLGLANVERANADLLRLATCGMTLDLVACLVGQLADLLPRSSDPDMALNNLERFVSAARSPLAIGALFERDPSALAVLVQWFSTSQHFSDQLIADPESFDLLRLTEGQPVARNVLVEELVAEVCQADGVEAVLDILRRCKRRESLRIGYGDIVIGQRLEIVTAQISWLADAIVSAALAFARRSLTEKRGVPRGPDGQPARFVALGLGKLGGRELNYSSDIDPIFLYDHDGQTDGRRSQSNHEFFSALVKEVVRLTGEMTPLGFAYRVDLRLRPDGDQGPLAINLESALRYYDVRGRTWERQAFIKARPIAGDLDLGHEFLTRLQPWIYRRYLGLADISGIKALKRRIEDRAHEEGGDERNVKTGRGGIRDIEFVIQFLQLLNGAELPQVRVPGTLEAIARLGDSGCLTTQEWTLLHENYVFLRRIEHLLQIMFDLQTHTLPEDPNELRKLALRLGYKDTPKRAALAGWQADFATKTAENRKILDHLLHDAFSAGAEAEPEVDLVLDPDPPPAKIEQVLSQYGFRDPRLSYERLNGLATERIPFLSTRRCRHFLAAIAPDLLASIAATPDPMSTLVNLDQVSDSLGGKGVLWELFSFNPPTLRLYVELCSASPFLCGILTSHPGMLDELMDSLVLNRLPTAAWLHETLAELLRNAEDADPILHGFKNAETLRVGVRDVLGKEDIQATTGALSDIAEVCLARIADSEYPRMVEKWGEPRLAEGPRAGETCRFAILAMGKFGGRELNYHSDLDVMFLFEDDGPTHSRRRGGSATTNQHFFSELGQRIIKVANSLGPYGRLYEVDTRLRPTGKSGALATSLPEFVRYFASGEGQLWERLAICRARVAHGEAAFARRVERAVRDAVAARSWRPEDAQEILAMRRKLEESAPKGNLKRGPGGLVDIEFLTQALQLRHVGAHPELFQPHTLEALAAAGRCGVLSADDVAWFQESYRFLRSVEGKLRLQHATARDDLPEDPRELDALARPLQLPDGRALAARCAEYRAENRRRFERLLGS